MLLDDVTACAPVRVPWSLDGLTVVGWSHASAPLPVLEQVAVPRGTRPRLLAALRERGLADAVVLSTCSRTEVYVADPGVTSAVLIEALAEHLGGAPSELLAGAQVRRGEPVVEHLFEVAAGLASRVVGEGEIRSQVRGALVDAQTAGMALRELRPLFVAAGRCAATVQDLTGLSGQARSLGRRAVDVGLCSLGEVADPAVLVVGAGQMARTAVAHLAALGRPVSVAARNPALAARLAGRGGVCPLPGLVAGVAQADLLVCATSASCDVLTLAHVQQAMASRGGRPLTVVDLSMPRNVDVRIADVDGVHLVDIEGLADDLAHDEALLATVAAGRAAVRVQARRYADAVAARAAGPLIAELRRAVEELCVRELQRSARDVEPEVLNRAAHAITGKLMHRPTLSARAAATTGDLAALRLIAEIFDAPPGWKEKPPPASLPA